MTWSNFGMSSLLINFLKNVRVRTKHALQEMLHFVRGRSPGKMLKVLATGRLPGVLPGAEWPANLLIANEPAKALAPGKCIPDTNHGVTPGKMCHMHAGFFWRTLAHAGFCRDHISHFQTMPGKLSGVNLWQNEYEFF